MMLFTRGGLDFAVKQDAIPGFINTAWTNVPNLAFIEVLVSSYVH